MIRRWVETANYEGMNYSDYYVAAQRFFRCSKQEAETFAYIREHLLDSCEHVASNHASPWPDVFDVTIKDEALIARYMVMVHKDAVKPLRMARMFEERLATKGYVDPSNPHDEDDDEAPPAIEEGAGSWAVEPTGMYHLIKLGEGRFTTMSAEPKNRSREREAVKRAQLLAETGSSPIARRIGGAPRRWSGVGYYGADGDGQDPVEA